MDRQPNPTRWMSIVMVLSIVLFLLYFAKGVLLAKSIGQCLAKRGSPGWEDELRALVLLACLPTAVLAVKRSLIASYFFIGFSALMFALAVLERDSRVNLHADSFIGITSILFGLFLYGRSAWMQQPQR